MSKTHLEWKHLVSPTMTMEQYLENHSVSLREHFENYEPDQEIIDKIRTLISERQEMVKIVALGADWCPDCSRNVPRMIKIVKVLNHNNIEMRILYGIMLNALHRPGETIWHRTKLRKRYAQNFRKVFITINSHYFLIL